MAYFCGTSAVFLSVFTNLKHSAFILTREIFHLKYYEKFPVFFLPNFSIYSFPSILEDCAWSRTKTLILHTNHSSLSVISLKRGAAWGSIYTLYLIFWAIYTLYLFFQPFIPYTLYF